MKAEIEMSFSNQNVLLRSALSSATVQIEGSRATSATNFGSEILKNSELSGERCGGTLGRRVHGPGAPLGENEATGADPTRRRLAPQSRLRGGGGAVPQQPQEACVCSCFASRVTTK